MREPEILRALPDLTREGWIAEPATTTVRRLAVGELVSVRGELRFALYVGVLLLVSVSSGSSRTTSIDWDRRPSPSPAR